MTVLLYVVGVLLVVLGVGLSIGLHEIGHLVPAKKFGVKVTQYMVGFGPTAGPLAEARPSTASRPSPSAATSG